MSKEETETKEPLTPFTKDQPLNFGDQQLIIHTTILTRENFTPYTLVAEASASGALVQELMSNFALLKSKCLLAIYEDVEVKVCLDGITKHEYIYDSSSNLKHQITFICSSAEATKLDGEFYDFILPHVNFGQGDIPTRTTNDRGGWTQKMDTIVFSINSVQWNLRHLYQINGELYTADKAFDLLNSTGSDLSDLVESGFARLSVRTDQSSKTVAIQTANDICWLLHLAFAQRVAWSELRTRTGDKTNFLSSNSLVFPKKVSAITPLRNWVDEKIKNYLETSYSIFKQDPEWWKLTINWYSIAMENSTIELTAFIHSMLFERISRNILLNHQFPKQIGEDLDKILNLKPKKKVLSKAVTNAFLEHTAGWTEHRTGQLLSIVKQWNEEPSYQDKTAKSYEILGLKPPDKNLLKLRNKLMHDGHLDVTEGNVLDYYYEINRNILVLLLVMLGYNGKFFASGYGEQIISDFKTPPKP